MHASAVGRSHGAVLARRRSLGMLAARDEPVRTPHCSSSPESASRRALTGLGVGEIVAAIAWLASDAAALLAAPRGADATLLRLERETWTGIAGVFDRSWLDVGVLFALAMIVGGVGILVRRSWGRTLTRNGRPFATETYRSFIPRNWRADPAWPTSGGVPIDTALYCQPAASFFAVRAIGIRVNLSPERAFRDSVLLRRGSSCRSEMASGRRLRRRRRNIDVGCCRHSGHRSPPTTRRSCPISSTALRSSRHGRPVATA